MILSARVISARLSESGCLTAIRDEKDEDGMKTKAQDAHVQCHTGVIPKKEQGYHLIILPFSPESLQPASYDLRVSLDMVLPKGCCTLVPSLEWVEIPGDLAATLRCRSSYGRRGVFISAGFVDPGFRGQLTFCLVNLGNEDIALKKKDRIVQMIIHEVREGGILYNGSYQDSHGAIHAR